MNRARTGAARTAVAALVLLLAPLLVAVESWHTCTLPAGIGSGNARVVTPVPGPAEAGPCPACSLARHSRLSLPGPALPAAGPSPVLPVAESGLPVPPGCSRMRPPGRAPPA